LSLFSPGELRFDVSKHLPLLTTKKLSLRIIFEELMFFIRGQTDGNILLNKNVKIWSGNGTREYLDSIGLLDYEENDLGPVYGFQWRHFGADYEGCKAVYTGEGYDQLRQVLKMLLCNPTSRRIIINSWNCTDLKKMALPPCHVMCQFYVTDVCGDKKLSLKVYQRSCDVGLGVPFNIASYAIFLKIIAFVVDMKPFEFVYSMGDAHIYETHIENLEMQVNRYPRVFPELKINKKIDRRYVSGCEDDIDYLMNILISFQFEDFDLIGYHPYDRIGLKMAL
jgi:thymidylate synthase